MEQSNTTQIAGHSVMFNNRPIPIWTGKGHTKRTLINWLGVAKAAINKNAPTADDIKAICTVALVGEAQSWYNVTASMEEHKFTAWDAFQAEFELFFSPPPLSWAEEMDKYKALKQMQDESLQHFMIRCQDTALQVAPQFPKYPPALQGAESAEVTACREAHNKFNQERFALTQFVQGVHLKIRQGLLTKTFTTPREAVSQAMMVKAIVDNITGTQTPRPMNSAVGLQGNNQLKVNALSRPQTNPKNGDKRKMYCVFCKFKGHTIDICRKKKAADSAKVGAVTSSSTREGDVSSSNLELEDLTQMEMGFWD